jgi:hypothetical protein
MDFVEHEGLQLFWPKQTPRSSSQRND